jgi:hypothetical protein
MSQIASVGPRGAALAACALVAAAAARADERAAVTFERQANQIEIRVGGRPLASYVFRDERILRPYLAHLRAGGVQVTRNLPPIAGTDATDHDTMHPGIWLAFGDVSGADFWRNKATVEHVKFVEPPTVDARGGEFVVENRYAAAGATKCVERCRIAVRPLGEGVLVVWDSTFSGPEEFYFGDQEEMGLGVRVATPLAVKNGGTLTNSDGLQGEKQVWGRQAEWCDYSGRIDGNEVGLLVVPDPKNFRRSWFHARDYGFVAANPFGRRAFTKGEASRVAVRPGETLRLAFGVLVHAGPIDLNAAARAVVPEFH